MLWFLKPLLKKHLKMVNGLSLGIHYGVFNASRVSLEITADTLDQVPVFTQKAMDAQQD